MNFANEGQRVQAQCAALAHQFPPPSYGHLFQLDRARTLVHKNVKVEVNS